MCLRIVFIMKKMILVVDSLDWLYYCNKPTVFALFTRIFFFFFFLIGEMPLLLSRWRKNKTHPNFFGLLLFSQR